LNDWFASRGWSVRQHQLEMLEAAQTGRHALLTAPTGAGKTLAGFLPTLIDLIEQESGKSVGTEPGEASGLAQSALQQAQNGRRQDGDLHTLDITPLKALAGDVQCNLRTPLADMELPITVETRSGDTPASRKARQRVKPPHILLTTPESLNLLLSQEDSFTLFANLKRVVIDEVHAFATGKRGDLLAPLTGPVAENSAWTCTPWPWPPRLPQPSLVVPG